MSSNRSNNNGRALIVHPVLPSGGPERIYTPELSEQLAEAEGLAHAIQLFVVGTRVAKVTKPSAGYLIGSGIRAEIAAQVEAEKPDVVIVNHSLSPVQQRNLEKEWQVKVIDRTGLILEIFGARAQTREGQLQVALASLDYQRSRLVRSWTHLERQRGGTGKTGGPGETQIELDRRMIADKIAKLKEELEGVRRNRDLQRRSRERVPYPIVAMVGYTNAGKSTLFNRLTGAHVFAENLLFATLDPTMRKLRLPSGQDIILADTVGFIADLPTHLIAAFRATLEQVEQADIILHVRDCARPDSAAQAEDVVKILGDLGINADTDPRMIDVLNKIDQADEPARTRLLAQDGVPISALTGEGIDGLLAAIGAKLAHWRRHLIYRVPMAAGDALSWLHQHGHVTSQRPDGEDMLIVVDLEPAHVGRFRQRFSINPLRET